MTQSWPLPLVTESSLSTVNGLTCTPDGATLKSKRMKEKQQRQADEKRTTLERRRLHRAAAKQPVDVHHASAKPNVRVRFDKSTHTRTRWRADDLMHAFTLADDERFDLHVDYAHTIAMGYHNQRYYLIMVIDGKDFLWATPTTFLAVGLDAILSRL